MPCLYGALDDYVFFCCLFSNAVDTAHRHCWKKLPRIFSERSQHFRRYFPTRDISSGHCTLLEMCFPCLPTASRVRVVRREPEGKTSGKLRFDAAIIALLSEFPRYIPSVFLEFPQKLMKLRFDNRSRSVGPISSTCLDM